MKKQDIAAYAYSKDGKLLAIGRNSYTKTHPLQAKFAKRAGNRERIYIHAEIDALIKARGPVHTVRIVRIGKNLLPLASKPCAICQLALAHYNVKEIEFIEPTKVNKVYLQTNGNRKHAT